MKKWKANWKKILIVLILILLLVFGILMYGKVSELTNQLAYLQDTTNIILSDDFKVYAERSILFALGRIGEQVSDVDARFSDLNGPRGGADKSCALIISMPFGAMVFVQTVDRSWQAAIDYAIDRASRATIRNLERRKRTESVQPQKTRKRAA